MPAAVIPIGSASRTSTGHATWSLLELARPGAKPVPLGILLVDDGSGKLTLRLRGCSAFSKPGHDPEEEELGEEELGEQELGEQELDILDFLESDLLEKSRERGGQALLDSLEDTLSNFLRIGERTAVAYTGDPQKMADRLFDQHVDGSVQPFVTHLPVYSLRAAATKFGEGMQSEQEGWMRAPGHLALQENMFVARVVGRSMEPPIPDGSLCVFRTGVTGTRQGKRLLIEQFGETDFASRYTVKRYTSVKRGDSQPSGSEDSASEDQAWEHERIRLEPLNREFQAFDLGPDEFRVIAEFVAVLD